MSLQLDAVAQRAHARERRRPGVPARHAEQAHVAGRAEAQPLDDGDLDLVLAVLRLADDLVALAAGKPDRLRAHQAKVLEAARLGKDPPSVAVALLGRRDLIGYERDQEE